MLVQYLLVNYYQGIWDKIGENLIIDPRSNNIDGFYNNTNGMLYYINDTKECSNQPIDDHVMTVGPLKSGIIRSSQNPSVVL